MERSKFWCLLDQNFGINLSRVIFRSLSRNISSWIIQDVDGGIIIFVIFSMLRIGDYYLKLVVNISNTSIKFFSSTFITLMNVPLIKFDGNFIENEYKRVKITKEDLPMHVSPKLGVELKTSHYRSPDVLVLELWYFFNWSNLNPLKSSIWCRWKV